MWKKILAVLAVLMALFLIAAGFITAFYFYQRNATAQKKIDLLEEEVAGLRSQLKEAKEDSSVSKPVTKAENSAQGVIKAYYGAINRRDYKTAYSYLTSKFQYSLSYSNFVKEYADYIDKVEVESMIKLEEFSSAGVECYEVNFDTVYIKPYPAGSGELPPIHYVTSMDPNDSNAEWRISDIGTGP